MVVVAEELFEGLWLVVFAAQSEHEHCSGVRMKHYVAQNVASVLVVAAKLRAAIVVMPGINRVDALFSSLLSQLGSKAFGYSVYASHCRHYPYLVSHSDVAVLTLVSHECPFLVCNIECIVYWRVCIVKGACKVGLQVVFVHPVAGFQVFDCVSDRITIFDDVLTLCCIL